MSETPEIIAGRNPVREALLAGTWTINKILLSQRAHGTAIEEIIRLARDRQIPLHHVPPERLDRLSSTSVSTEWMALRSAWSATSRDSSASSMCSATLELSLDDNAGNGSRRRRSGRRLRSLVPTPVDRRSRSPTSDDRNE
jgi:tRNA G18 (ribose-2'-O)-methylase SpoU